MLLALSIVSEQGSALGPSSYKVFDERGGSIGRVAGNDWVLPDAQNFVSSKHARVSAAAGVFYLEDTSSNGTFINAPDRLASRAELQALSDGDRLYIGDYEIIVQLIPSAPTEATVRTPAVARAAPAVVMNGTAPSAISGHAAQSSASPSAGVRASPQAAAFATPPSALGLGTVDPLAALGASSLATPAPVLTPRPNAQSVTPPAVEVGRSDALSAPSAPLGAIDAPAHQAAMRAAARAGFNAMLAKLHPQALEELYDRKLKRTAMLGLGNKAKYWEMLRAQFDEIDRDREAHFQQLFGEEFALAYNEHLQKLAADARLRKPR